MSTEHCRAIRTSESVVLILLQINECSEWHSFVRSRLDLPLTDYVETQNLKVLS